MKWKEFAIGELFNIHSTSSGIDKIKLSGKSGRIPYITRSDANNGCDSFIAEQEGKLLDSGNVITIGLDTQTIFYQGNDFYTGQNIQVMNFDKLDRSVAFFLIPLLKKQMVKFNWGGNGATLTRLRKTKILLPIDTSGEPDYEYMSAYTKEIENAKLEKYRAWIQIRLENSAPPFTHIEYCIWIIYRGANGKNLNSVMFSLKSSVGKD